MFEIPKFFDDELYYNASLIDVTVYQSRSAITVPQAYKNAIHWELDYLDPEVFAMAGARNPHPTCISRKTPQRQFHRIQQRPRPRRQEWERISHGQNL